MTPNAKAKTIPTILPILKNDPTKGLISAGQSSLVMTGASIGYIPHVTPSKNLPIKIVYMFVTSINPDPTRLTAPIK